MIFLLLFIFTFALGSISLINPRRSIVLFTFFITAFPTSNAFSDMVYFNGIMISDGYFLGVLPYVLYRINAKNLFKGNRNLIFSVFFFLNIFLLYFLFGFYNTSEIDMLLKELRPILLFVQILILALFTANKEININFKTISRVALVAAMTNMVWFCFSYLNYFSFSDVYFDNNSNRYWDLSNYFSIYYLIHYNFLRTKNLLDKRKLYSTAVILSIGSILLTNSRFLIISLIASLLFIKSVNLKGFIKYIIVSLFLVLLFIQFSEIIGQDRISNSLNYKGFITQLLNRYSPALYEMEEMGFRELIFGFGLGHYFEIPWFFYREMDSINVSMDSGYLTHFVKQGVIGVSFLIIASKALCRTRYKKLSWSFHFFWLLIFFVSASFYQNVAYGALVYLALLNSYELNTIYEKE